MRRKFASVFDSTQSFLALIEEPAKEVLRIRGTHCLITYLEQEKSAASMAMKQWSFWAYKCCEYSNAVWISTRIQALLPSNYWSLINLTQVCFVATYCGQYRKYFWVNRPVSEEDRITLELFVGLEELWYRMSYATQSSLVQVYANIRSSLSTLKTQEALREYYGLL